ncbi:hypothetical protein JCM5350_001822 [Sporobolomyces pararoseus]
MTSLEALDTQVKTVISKNKLSSSAVDSIVKAALENVSSDTSLITLLYRHHKKAAPTHKLTSLYLIDAIARAARSKYKKEGKAKQQEEPTTTPKDQPPESESSAGTGTCGSFLKKLEGLLSKIVLDVWENAPVEHREKVRKVMDIWTKAGTFSSSALARLGNKLLATSTSTESKSAQRSPVAPMMSPTGPSASPGLHPPPSASTSSSVQPPDVPIPANVLALLQATAQAEPSEAAREQQKKEEEERMIQRVLAEAQGGPKAFETPSQTASSNQFPPSSSQPHSFPSSSSSFGQQSQQSYAPPSASTSYDYSAYTNPSIQSSTSNSYTAPPPSRRQDQSTFPSSSEPRYQTSKRPNGDFQQSYGQRDSRERGYDDRGQERRNGTGGGYRNDERRNQNGNGFGRDSDPRGGGGRGRDRGRAENEGDSGWGRRGNDSSRGGYRGNSAEGNNETGWNGNEDGNGYDRQQRDSGRGYGHSDRYENQTGGWRPDREMRERGRDQERQKAQNWQEEEEADHGIAGIDDSYPDELYNDSSRNGGGSSYESHDAASSIGTESRAPLPPDARAPLPERKRSRSPSVDDIYEQSTSPTTVTEPPLKKPFQPLPPPASNSSSSVPPPASSGSDNIPPFNPTTFSALSPESWSSFINAFRDNHPYFVAQKSRNEWPTMAEVLQICGPSAFAMFGNPAMRMAMAMGAVGGGENAAMGNGMNSNSTGANAGQQQDQMVENKGQEQYYGGEEPYYDGEEQYYQ